MASEVISAYLVPYLSPIFFTRLPDITGMGNAVLSQAYSLLRMTNGGDISVLISYDGININDVIAPFEEIYLPLQDGNEDTVCLDRKFPLYAKRENILSKIPGLMTIIGCYPV